MKKKDRAPIVISLGGSLIVPEAIDTDFIKKFKAIIDKEVGLGKRFIIICGGGRIARNYQIAGQKITKLRSADIDWLGIHSTRLNSQLIKTIFLPKVEEIVVHDPHEKITFKKSILVAAGWKPGWSTDYDAILLAKRFKATKVINLSNIDYVCDKDPKKHSDAKVLLNITWKDYRKLIPTKWSPGLSSPFDPIASKEAEKSNIKVAVISGENLDQLDNFIYDKPFEGTLIY
ncbi:MAG: UMP kinase [Candidatus Paceibacterota bacterium]